jgi:hypothetical protein
VPRTKPTTPTTKRKTFTASAVREACLERFEKRRGRAWTPAESERLVAALGADPRKCRPEDARRGLLLIGMHETPPLNDLDAAVLSVLLGIRTFTKTQNEAADRPGQPRRGASMLLDLERANFAKLRVRLVDQLRRLAVARDDGTLTKLCRRSAVEHVKNRVATLLDEERFVEANKETRGLLALRADASNVKRTRTARHR